MADVKYDIPPTEFRGAFLNIGLGGKILETVSKAVSEHAGVEVDTVKKKLLDAGNLVEAVLTKIYDTSKDRDLLFVANLLKNLSPEEKILAGIHFLQGACGQLIPSSNIDEYVSKADLAVNEQGLLAPITNDLSDITKGIIPRKGTIRWRRGMFLGDFAEGMVIGPDEELIDDHHKKDKLKLREFFKTNPELAEKTKGLMQDFRNFTKQK